MRSGMLKRFPLLLISLLSVWQPAAVSADESVLWRVLSDNHVSGEPSIETGATYTADPPFTNPPDASGRRLVNGDREGGNWNDVAGINNANQTVVFDLQAIHRVGKVELLLSHAQKPKSVSISLALHSAGPWTVFGTIVPGEIGPGPAALWHQAAVDAAREARYVRLFFELDNWGWYVNEVKLWGLRGDEPTQDTVLPSETDGDGNTLLTRDGLPRASIVVAAEPTRKSLAAAGDLQDHILNMSGAVLPIRTDNQAWSGTLLLVGPSTYVDRADVDVPTGYPENEQIIVKTVGSSIVLIGNDDQSFTGTEFAVQALLEKLGCGWFGPDALWQPIPHKKTIAVGPLDIEHVPAFKHRSIWIGLGKRWYQGGVDLNVGHAHAELLPPAQYFGDHPEYYALVGGKRTADGEWQLCTTNPEVIRLTVEKACRYFDEHPNRMTFSLGNNDTGGFCECEACAKSGSNPAARMLVFANAVARELRIAHPGKYVTNYAYWYTFAAPVDPIRSEPGVVIVPVGQGCHAHPIEEPACPTNAGFKDNLQRWASTGVELGFYEWYIPGCSQEYWRRIPWVAGRTALADQQLLRASGVKWLTYESQHAYEENAYPLRWPLFYVAAKGMWDAELAFEVIIRDACEKLYGPAALPMCAYYSELERAIHECPVHGGIWNLPSPLDVYPEDVQTRLSGHLAAAWEAATGSASEIQARIAAERKVWDLAVVTIEKLREETQESHTSSFTIRYNDTEYMVNKKTLTGRELRDLFGVLGQQKVILVEGDRDRQIDDHDQCPIANGMQFRSTPRR